MTTRRMSPEEIRAADRAYLRFLLGPLRFLVLVQEWEKQYESAAEPEIEAGA